MCLIHLALVIFLGSVKIFALDSSVPQSEDFVFPLEKLDDFTVCTFKNGTVGQCVNLSECPNARNEYQRGIHPTLCRFDKEEPVVCCMKQMVHPLPLFDPSALVKRRKSVAQCEDVYSLAVPFISKPGEFHVTVVGGSVTSEAEFPHMVITKNKKKMVEIKVTNPRTKH